MSPEIFTNNAMDLPDDSINEYELQKFMTSLQPVNRLLHIFSLHYCLHPEKHSKFDIVRKVFVSGVLCGVVVLSTFFKIRHFSNVRVTLSIKLTDGLQLVFDYLQSVVDLFYVHIYGRSTSIQYFKQYLKLDKILGIDQYIEIRKHVLKLVIILIIIWIGSSSFDFMAISLSFGCYAAIVYASSYLFVFLKTLTILDMTAQIIHIQYRLRFLNDLLHRLAKSEDLSEVVCVSTNNLGWSYKQTKKTPALKSSSVKFESEWISRIYLGLLEQTTFINDFFRVRILLNSLSLVIDMVKFSNILLRLILVVEPEPIATDQPLIYFPAISNTLRILTGVSLILCLVTQCEKTYRQREKIINLIDRQLTLKKSDDDITKSLLEFRPLVKSRPLEFHLNNFFRLDYSFLTSTASVVVTYTIILLQSIN